MAIEDVESNVDPVCNVDNPFRQMLSNWSTILLSNDQDDPALGSRRPDRVFFSATEAHRQLRSTR